MIEVDLLPESLRPPRAAGAVRRAPGPRGRGFDMLGTALLVAALTVPPGVGRLWWTQRAEAAALQARAEAAAADSARLAGLRALSDSLLAKSHQIRERVALVERLDRNRFAWPRMLNEISWALPSLAWLFSLRQLSPPPDLTVELQGIAANPLAITQFVRSLGVSEYVADVSILGSQQREAGSEPGSRHAFTLVLRLVAPPGARRAAPIIGSGGG